MNAPLTRREHEVLVLRAKGLPVKAVAAEMGVGVGTVSTHMQRALAKLGATCLIEALYSLGWIRTDSHEDHLRREIELEKAAHRARVKWLRDTVAQRHDYDEIRYVSPVRPQRGVRWAGEGD